MKNKTGDNPEKKIRYRIGGGKKSLIRKEGWLKKYQKSYVEKTEGSETTIDDGRNLYKYRMRSEANHVVMNCSKAVKKQCIEFEECHGSLSSGEYKNIWMSDGVLFSSFLRNFFGNKTAKRNKKTGSKKKRRFPEIAYVDVNHCYWQIAHNYGIINDDTYFKYKDERLARLTAIGCRQRSSYTDYYEYGKLVNRVVERNPLAWVWDFVNYKAFLTMESVRSSFAVFSYYTDGVYLPAAHAKAAADLILSKHGLSSKIEYFDVIGIEGRFLVLYGKTSKRYKRTRMTLTDEARELLPDVDYAPYKALNKELDREEAFVRIDELERQFVGREITRKEFEYSVYVIKRRFLTDYKVRLRR